LLFALVVSAAVSGTAECVQIFYPDRFPSLVDIANNTLGAALGVFVARLAARYTPVDLSAIRLGSFAGILALIPLTILILAVVDRERRDGFSNWDPTYQLAVGNELSGDRPWHGTIHTAAVYDEALSSDTIKTLSSRGSDGLDAAVAGALMRIEQPMDESDPSWGRPLLDAPATRAVFDALVERNKLSILVWFRGKPMQKGDGRILTFSRDPFLRNFTIGYYQDHIFFRLRTPRTGLNGNDPQITTPELSDGDRQIFAAATFDGRVSRLYIDGRLLARANLSAYNWSVPFLVDSGLPASATLTGMLLAVAVLALGRRPARERRWIVGPVAGLAAGILLLLVGAAAAVPAFAVWVPVFGCGGGLVIAASVRYDWPKVIRPKGELR
jgi:hypothetical protein